VSENLSSRSIAGWIPILQWIRLYDAGRFRLDLMAGLSLAAFTIPESLAYASLAQLPPITGLYCYLVAGLAYVIFGTSRQLAVGPTSALAMVIATSVAALGGGDPARTLGLASALALIVGIVSVAGRGIGLANAAYFISDPILRASRPVPASTSPRHSCQSCSASRASAAISSSASPMSSRSCPRRTCPRC